VKVQGDYSTITTSLPLEAANFTKLIIVRHPFARLVSAYKDKVRNEPKQRLSKDFSRASAQMTRSRGKSLAGELALLAVRPHVAAPCVRFEHATEGTPSLQTGKQR